MQFSTNTCRVYNRQTLAQGYYYCYCVIWTDLHQYYYVSFQRQNDQFVFSPSDAILLAVRFRCRRLARLAREYKRVNALRPKSSLSRPIHSPRQPKSSIPEMNHIKLAVLILWLYCKGYHRTRRNCTQRT